MGRWSKEALAVSGVATLATAPLVAAYFHVVSIFGVVVNLVAIPLVLGLALPLGEAAVLAQSLGLTLLARGFLTLGRLPLELGYGAIKLAAGLPWSAVTLPSPRAWQIGLYWLFWLLVFPRRRTVLTWSGAALAAVVLAGSFMVPAGSAPRILEITCLDTYGGLSALAVSPDGRRQVISAGVRSFPGSPARPGPLAGYLHWRQWRGLDQMVALNLSRSNTRELLEVAGDFPVGTAWYGLWSLWGEADWDLVNLMGDRGTPFKPVFGRYPLTSLGSAALEFSDLGEGKGVALACSWEKHRIMILPPALKWDRINLPAPREPGLEVLFLPGETSLELITAEILPRLRPRRLVIYGRPHWSLGPEMSLGGVPCHFTRDGAVTVFISPGGTTVRQWRGGK